MGNLFSVIKFIISHPIGKRNKWGCIKKFLSWQISQKIFNYPVIHPFVDSTKLIVAKGMKGATGNMYVGLHECQDMAFLLHFLRGGDRFFDIGANIGSYTLLAAGVVGTPTISIEPVPTTFKILTENIFLNGIGEKVTALNNGAGASEGNLFFTSDNDTVNHVVLHPKPGDAVIGVQVTSLDKIVSKYFVPTCIKIDVEGYETEVLNGATQLLQNPDLEVIIIELIGSGTTFGFDEKAIHIKLVSHGFAPFTYEPFTRKLLPANGISKQNNQLYLRDVNAVRQKVKSARKYSIMGVEL